MPVEARPVERELLPVKRLLFAAGHFAHRPGGSLSTRFVGLQFEQTHALVAHADTLSRLHHLVMDADDQLIQVLDVRMHIPIHLLRVPPEKAKIASRSFVVMRPCRRQPRVAGRL